MTKRPYIHRPLTLNTSESSIKWDEEEKRYVLLQNKVQHVTLRFGSGNKANLSFFFTRENDFNKFDIFMSFRRLTIN